MSRFEQNLTALPAFERNSKVLGAVYRGRGLQKFSESDRIEAKNGQTEKRRAAIRAAGTHAGRPPQPYRRRTAIFTPPHIAAALPQKEKTMAKTTMGEFLAILISAGAVAAAIVIYCRRRKKYLAEHPREEKR